MHKARVATAISRELDFLHCSGRVLAVISEPMTIRSRVGTSPYLAPAAMVLMLLAVLGYRHLRSSPMDGTWLREAGAGVMPDAVTGFPLMPDQISARLTPKQFTTRYWGPLGGVEHITLQLDGGEHLYLSIPGTEVKVTYRAQMDRSAVVVSKHVFTPSRDLGSCTERWSLAEGANRLTVASNCTYDYTGTVGKQETVYSRPPLLRSLFRASP